MDYVFYWSHTVIICTRKCIRMHVYMHVQKRIMYNIHFYERSILHWHVIYCLWGVWYKHNLSVTFANCTCFLPHFVSFLPHFALIFVTLSYYCLTFQTFAQDKGEIMNGGGKKDEVLAEHNRKFLEDAAMPYLCTLPPHRSVVDPKRIRMTIMILITMMTIVTLITRMTKKTVITTVTMKIMSNKNHAS